jgi:hypothetical protein
LGNVELALKNGLLPQQAAALCEVSLSTVYRVRSQKREILQVVALRQLKDQLLSRRQEWEKTVETYGSAGLKQVRCAAAATYAWLYRHDRSWLQNSTKALGRKCKSSRPRIDWSSRDLVLYEQVTSFVRAVKQHIDRPRISKTLMTRQVGEALVRVNLARLPKLKALLETLEEPEFAYQMYRIDRAIQRIKEQGKGLQLWRIQRVAGIRQWTSTHAVYTQWQVKIARSAV